MKKRARGAVFFGATSRERYTLSSFLRLFCCTHTHAEHRYLATRAFKACQQTGLGTRAAGGVNHAMYIQAQVG